MHTGHCVISVGQEEKVEHVLIKCVEYETLLGINSLSLQALLWNGPNQSRIYHKLKNYQKEIRMDNRI